MNILVINGPNLNLLGERNIPIYGNDTLDELMHALESSSEGKGISFCFFQSNHEGEIIDKVHSKRNWAKGIIINPGALTHYSYSIRDSIEAVNIPTIEVHLSNINNRESFRKISVISEVCIAQIQGLGSKSYFKALGKLVDYIK